jgi:hypothetical protein
MALADQSDSETWDAEADGATTSSGSTSALLTKDSGAKTGIRAFRAVAMGILVAAALFGALALSGSGGKDKGSLDVPAAATKEGVALFTAHSHSSCGNLQNHNYLATLREQCPAWLSGEIPTAVENAHAQLTPHMQEQQKDKMKSCCQQLRASVRALQSAASSPNMAQMAQNGFNATEMAQIEAYGRQIFDRYSRNRAPDNDRSDGNTCADDEELFMGLCYKKCEQLTNSSHNVRTSAWSCCTQHACNPLTQMKHSIGMCSGYDVGGDSQGPGACPHPPGSCLDNEEMFLGTCYAKCSDLTNGAYQHRFNTFQCCTTTGMSCFLPSNVDTSTRYAAGGGKGDYDSSTPATAHAPLTSLTEN